MSKTQKNNRTSTRTKRGGRNSAPNTNKSSKPRRSYPSKSLPRAFGMNTKPHQNPNMRLKRREFLFNVGAGATDKLGNKLFRQIPSGSNGLLTSVVSIAGNVGLTSAFPWLSNVARFFEKFIFHVCTFEYVPSTGSTTSGTVSMCPTYNPGESSEGATKVDYLDRAGATRSAAWQENKCSIDPKKCNSSIKSHLVRTGEAKEIELTDPFRVDVVTEVPVTDSETNLGEIWADYEVELMVPKGSQDGETISSIFTHTWDNCASGTVATYSTANIMAPICDDVRRESTSPTLQTVYYPIREKGQYLVIIPDDTYSMRMAFYTAPGSSLKTIQSSSTVKMFLLDCQNPYDYDDRNGNHDYFYTNRLLATLQTGSNFVRAIFVKLDPKNFARLTAIYTLNEILTETSPPEDLATKFLRAHELMRLKH